MPQSHLCKQMQTWGCLALGILAQSHGTLWLPALGSAIWHCASPVVALWISKSLPAAGREQPCLEFFIRSLRHQPVLRLNWEGMRW